MSNKRHRSTLAPLWGPNVAIAVGALSTLPAMAQTTSTESSVTQLSTIQATAEALKADHISSAKFTAPLVDTPQSIQVIPKEVLKQQNAQTLQEVLRNTPGITFSAGEGGAGWGDMFTIRGMQGEQSVTQDEVRDSQLTTRTDTFNLEQVDVYKGTGSFETGVGAIGGGINLVSKKPKLENFNVISLGLGSDNYRRATFDTNHKISDSTAIRLNAMAHRNDVAGRGPVEMKRWGVAPSITFGLGSATRLNLSYFEQKDDNLPDFGVPVGTDGTPLRGVGYDYWSGALNYDVEQTHTRRASAKFEHDFSDKLRFSNQTTWSQTDRFTSYASGGRLLNLPRKHKIKGSLVEAKRFDTSDYFGFSGKGTGRFTENYPSGYLAVARIQNYSNKYRGEILANQSNVNMNFMTGSVEHDLLLGLDLYKESYRKRPFSRTVPSSAPTRWLIDVRDPDHYYTGPVTKTISDNRSGAQIENIGVYVYDHIKFNPQWELAAGLRHDTYRAKWWNADGSVSDARQKINVWSGRVGLVYKPTEDGSIYLSYSQAKQPSVAAMASRTGGGQNNADYSPAKTSTWELGTKWNLLNDDLFLTAAIFQVDKSNPTDTDPDTNEPTQLAAKDQVRGIELTAAGNISERWSVYSGLSLLNSKILRDDSNPAQKGGRLKNVPNMTFNLWTTYSPTEKLALSIGAQYVGKRQFTRGNVATGANWGGIKASTQARAYWVANAAVSYRVNKHVDLRLNVNNIFNKKYFAQTSSSSDGFQKFGVPGVGRNIQFSTDISF